MVASLTCKTVFQIFLIVGNTDCGHTGRRQSDTTKSLWGSLAFHRFSCFQPTANLLSQLAVCALVPAPYSVVTSRNSVANKREKP